MNVKEWNGKEKTIMKAIVWCYICMDGLVSILDSYVIGSMFVSMLDVIINHVHDDWYDGW